MRHDSFMDVRSSKRKLVIGSSAIAVVSVLWLWPLVTGSVNMLSAASPPTGLHGTYTTHFPLTENPISEGGKWECGRTVGLDWVDIETIPGRAFGLQLGTGGFDDATALLTGAWGPNQVAQGTVFCTITPRNQRVEKELSLRLRSSLSAHSCTGYEINFRCTNGTDAFAEIVRWEGPFSDFSNLIHHDGREYAIRDGDVIKATIIGNVISGYINGWKVVEVTDNTFATGQPGMGIWLRGYEGNTTALNHDYGFSDFMASDDEPVLRHQASAAPAEEKRDLTGLRK
jgi:hypothetical protein